jgi:hypothetical protein
MVPLTEEEPMPKPGKSRGQKARPSDHDRHVRIHEGLTLIQVDRPADLEDLRALPEVRAAWVRQLGPRLAVLDDARLPELLAALEKHGTLPRVVQADEED